MVLLSDGRSADTYERTTGCQGISAVGKCWVKMT